MPTWLSVPPNLVDVLIALIILSYAWQGYSQGWLVTVVQLAGFALTLLVALGFYTPLARQLVVWTPLGYGMSKPAAFVLLWLASGLLYGSFAHAVFRRQWARTWRPALERLLALWPGAVRGLLVATVLLTVAGSLPLPEPFAETLRESRFEQELQPRGSVLADQFSQVFGDAIQETLGLLTVRPDSNERLDLRFTVQNPPLAPDAEERMLELVNRERTTRGLKALQVDPGLREVARAHSRDMLGRGYFAHIDLDGGSPFDRMRAGDVRFTAAGENIALAPSVEIAHNGLMNSPAHRENILNGGFGRAGIGVADGQLHGKMFTQNFAN